MLSKKIWDNTINSKNSEIEKLTSDKEKLLISNGNLLQKVSMEKEEAIKPKQREEQENPKDFDFASLFDKKGNFK